MNLRCPMTPRTQETRRSPYKCDSCRSPLYLLLLRRRTECSLCDEVCTNWAWCECGVARSFVQIV